LNALPRLLPNLKFPVALDVGFLTSDKAEVEKYSKDPLVHNQGDLRLLSFLSLKVKDELMALAPNFQLPLLIVHGSDDKITSPASSRSYFDACASKDKKYELFEGLRSRSS
jgi:alpha-beta hydrolase superfamily lysophospholipase